MSKKRYYVNERGLYETSRTINGKRVKFRGKTVAEVDRKILEYNEDRRKGRSVPVIADEWYAEHESKISHSTYRVYGFAVRRIKDAFPGRSGEVKPLDCQRYITNFERQGYALDTVQIEMAVMRMIFAHAVLAGDIDVNPAAEVKHGKHLPKKKRTSLTEEQEQKVENCRKGEWWLLGLMLLYTGCRRGELLALTWQDIDRNSGVIHVTKKLNYSYGNTPKLEGHLKSENGKRDIPLLQPLADALPRNRIGKIFTNEHGEYLTSAQLGRVWKEYCRDADLMEWDYDESGKPVQIPAVTPHCFRHSFATICYEAGLDPKTTAELVGDTEQVVQSVYTDLRQRHKVTSVEKINAYLSMRQQEAETKEG